MSLPIETGRVDCRADGTGPMMAVENVENGYARCVWFVRIGESDEWTGPHRGLFAIDTLNAEPA